MNLLFVNYGQSDNNSSSHIRNLALALNEQGHNCVIAVAKVSPADRFEESTDLTIVDHKRGLTDPALFDNGKPADCVHAWTPREIIRKFVFSYFRIHPDPALIIHLEDNEEVLLERFTGRPFDQLCRLPEDFIATLLNPGNICPYNYRPFLALADGISVIHRALSRFVPEGVDWCELPPIINHELFAPRAKNIDLARKLGISLREKIVCYPGNDHYANTEDIRSLYTAIHLLNHEGTPVRLIRAGETEPHVYHDLPFDPDPFTIELGYIPHTEIPAIMSLADVYVQPGVADKYNAYRLPAKVPEFLSMGKPVILARANVATELEHDINAQILYRADAREIANACLRIFSNPDLAEQISQGGMIFAQRRFAKEPIVTIARNFYETCLATSLSQPGARFLADPGKASASLAPTGAAGPTLPPSPCSTQLASVAHFLSAEVRESRKDSADSRAELQEALARLKQSEKARQQIEREHFAERDRLRSIIKSSTWSFAKRLYSIEKRLRSPFPSSDPSVAPPPLTPTEKTPSPPRSQDRNPNAKVDR